jgi:hypothetical protein
MGKGYIAIIALAVNLAAGAAYVEEDFDGPTFPPAGWSIITENNGCRSIGWRRVNRGGGNYCAHGYASGYYMSAGTTVLASKTLPLKQGSVAVSFERYCTAEGGLFYWLKLQLRQGTRVVWYREYASTSSWAPIRLTVPVYWGDDYEIGWALEAFFGNPRLGGTVYLYVDNAVVEESTAVAATSLGRVRALYR